ncbi:hypothetical protein FB451DRAFT_366177 [Mycena latifolia]|nr:hypothetical protein FB451DRAFT_366177 [Mycena latifolia]
MRLMRITRGLDRSCVPQESTPGRIALNSGHLTATLTYRTLPNAHGGSAVADISHARICDSCCVGSYPSHFAIGFIRGDGERWGGSAFLLQKAAEHDPRCRRSSRPSTISANASSAGGRAAYAPPCGARGRRGLSIASRNTTASSTRARPTVAAATPRWRPMVAATTTQT